MNSAPGIADPNNAVLPFGEFDCLHFARLALLDDPTLGDIEAYGLPRPRAPVYLAFLGDCDGPAREFLAKLAQRAGAGLRRIFSHCEGFDAATDLLAWMTAHNVPSSASYVNWVGRTVQQVVEAVLERLSGAAARVHAAGRTDAGVHAVGMGVSFSLPDRWTPDALRRAERRTEFTVSP